MALTDLTGTTWTLNSTLTSYAGGTYSRKSYSVTITTDTALPTFDGDADTFVVFEVGYDSGGEHNVVWLYTSTPTSYSNSASFATGEDTKTLPDTWVSRYEGTFTVTGGTDATNSTLIAWMEDNCTSTTPPTPPTPPTPDVVVTYEGTNIVELSEAGTKTLKTAGKYLTDDVVLTYSGGSGGGTGGVTVRGARVTVPKRTSTAQSKSVVVNGLGEVDAHDIVLFFGAGGYDVRPVGFSGGNYSVNVSGVNTNAFDAFAAIISPNYEVGSQASIVGSSASLCNTTTPLVGDTVTITATSGAKFKVYDAASGGLYASSNVVAAGGTYSFTVECATSYIAAIASGGGNND